MTFPYVEAQSLTPDAKITLWRLDLSLFGLPKVAFTSHILPDGSPVSFGGEPFASIPLEFEGFDHNSDGGEVSPTLTLPRASVVLSSLFKQYDDCKACPIERLQTYRMHLDDGTDPDVAALLSYELYVIDRVVRPADKFIFEIELADPITQAGTKLPARTVTRDYCPFAYRVFDPDSGVFNYTDVFCPYAGVATFDEDANPVADPAADRCGKMLRDCEIRFPGGVKIPFGGFPGAGTVKA